MVAQILALGERIATGELNAGALEAKALRKRRDASKSGRLRPRSEQLQQAPPTWPATLASGRAVAHA